MDGQHMTLHFAIYFVYHRDNSRYICLPSMLLQTIMLSQEATELGENDEI